MNLSKLQLWERFQKYCTDFPTLGLSVDLSRMMFADGFFATMEPRLQKAFSAMSDLEKGAIVNRDEGRMVGRYWLGNPSLAPTPEIRLEIENAIAAVKSFAAQVHSGAITAGKGVFPNPLLKEIGGSALGPQFVSNALGHPDSDQFRFYCFDNTYTDVIYLQLVTSSSLPRNHRRSLTSVQIAPEIGRPDDVEAVFKICEHLAANHPNGVMKLARHSLLEAEYTAI